MDIMGGTGTPVEYCEIFWGVKFSTDKCLIDIKTGVFQEYVSGRNKGAI